MAKVHYLFHENQVKKFKQPLQRGDTIYGWQIENFDGQFHISRVQKQKKHRYREKSEILMGNFVVLTDFEREDIGVPIRNHPTGLKYAGRPIKFIYKG